MAIAGMTMYESTSSYLGMYFGGKQGNSPEADNGFAHTLSQHSEKTYDASDLEGKYVRTSSKKDSELGFDVVQCMPVMAKGYGDPAAYTRCITANIKTKEMLAHETSDGDVIYSYAETEKSFQVIINSDEQENKTYTIKGTDDNGEEFEREFDPYNLDPECMDYPEFSALCMYIKETDETADLIASSYFTDTSYFGGIFDRGDRVGLLGKYAEEYEHIGSTLATHAQKLLNAITDFFAKASMDFGIDDNVLSLLLGDRDEVQDTVLSHDSEYTNPESGEKVPVSVKYTTSYSEDGISCRRDVMDGDKKRSEEYWSIRFDDKDDYSRVKGLLSSFDEDERLTFASQKTFWEDYLSGNLNVDEFKDYFRTSNNGFIDFEGRVAAGEKLRDIVLEPYAGYLNNQGFIGRVYTEQEMAEGLHENLTPLGMGFANAGNMGYGMSASLVTSDETDDVIIRVKASKGGGNYEAMDVNLSEFDPKKATAVEMFAYCQYKDACGEGTDHKWGSWNAIKSVISPVDGMDFGSLDNILNEKRNWTGALAKSETVMKNPRTGETLSAADLLKVFMEQNKLTADELKEGGDFRDMSDDEWDKLLESVDGYIDAYKEEIRERVRKQIEAAQKAALEADPERQATAAQEAVLAVASSGFDAGGDSGEEQSVAVGEDSENDHEKNWTRKLKTDDQVILRTAKAAQTMESQALQRMEEMMATGVSSYASYADAFTRFLKDRESLNFV